MKKLFSSFLLFSFFLSSPVFAELEAEESYQSLGGKKTLICLEGVPDDPLSRTTFENSLESILEKEKIRTIFTEAGAGDLSLSIFQKKVPFEVREKVASDALSKGTLQAGEYLTLVFDRDLVYWGIENPLLYETFINVHASLEKGRKMFKKRLEELILEKDPKRSSEVLQSFRILLHLVDLKAAPEELEFYRDHPEKFDPENFLGMSPKEKEWIETASTLQEFYNLLDQRETFFVENLLQKMDSDRVDRAVFVLAPIHRQMIKKLFKERDLSYQFLRPQDDEISGARSLPFVPRQMRAQLPYELAAGKKPALWVLGKDLGLDTEESLKVVKDLTDASTAEIVTRKGIKNPSFSWVEDVNKPALKNSTLVETIFEIERRLDVEKYKAFKAFTKEDKKEAREETDKTESQLLEEKLRAYERSLAASLQKADQERADVFEAWKKTGENIKTAYDRSFALRFVASSFSAILSPFLGPVFSANGSVGSLLPIIPFPVDMARLQRVSLFLETNVTAGGMPLTFKAPPGFWESFKSPMDPVDAVMERLLTTHGLSIYDGALWQMALTIFGDKKSQVLVDAYTDRLLSGSSGELHDIRAYDPIFKYGDEKKTMDRDHAYFFRMIADEYIQKDPMGLESLEGFPNFALLHHEDWKPITGEQAWAAIMGPLQVAYVKYGGKIPLDSKEMQLALSVLPAVEAMRSKIGAIYHVPEGTHGKNPHDISNENNFSMYAALQMLYSILKDQDPATAKQIEILMKGQEYFFRHYAFDREDEVFYQGGFYVDGKFIPTKIFAVDCQAWALNSLGPEWIDNTFGEGTSYHIWQNTLEHAAYFSQNGTLQGLGFSDGHRIISAEWTCGAILAAKQMAHYYQVSHPSWARKLERDAIAMRYGIDEFKMLLPDGSEAYLYSNERYFIPFGWWANPIPNLASSAWVILVDLGFNPFVLGGGPDYKKSSQIAIDVNQ